MKYTRYVFIDYKLINEIDNLFKIILISLIKLKRV